MTTEPPGAARRFGKGFHRGRRAFRRWRRGRPFWAGLFLMLSGIGLFLSTQLSLPDLEISFGPQGFLAILLPVVMLLCGVLVWVTPQHRLFYSVIGMLTAVYSLLGLNLGGWFISMLLGITGGALGIAWTPVRPQPPAVEAAEPAPGPPDPDQPEEPDERPTLDIFGPLVDEPPGTDQTAPVRAPRQDPPSYVTAALPLLLTAALAAPAPVTQICLPLLCPDPPAETPTPTPDPTPTPAPDPEPTGEPEPGPSPTPSPEPTDPGEDPTDPAPEPVESELPTCDDEPVVRPVVAARPALMTADQLEQQSFRFECIDELPTGNGGSIRVLKFSFSRATATNFSLTTTGEGQPARVTADPLVLAGEVTFYTDRFTGLLGVVPLELTPDSPVVDLLDLVNIALPVVVFTDVELNLVFTEGAELTATGFRLSLP